MFSKKCLFSIYFILLISPILCLGQYDVILDSTSFDQRTERQPLTFKKMAIPVGLTATALLMTNGDFEQELQPKVNRNLKTNIDDYTRFAPLAVMYISDGLGAKAENHWFDQTKNAGLSLLLTQAITTGLKITIDKERPNGANEEAFPSGHTSLAFASATVLHEEFKNTEPILAYSGYAFAISTAYLRMAKNKHWLSDVILGSALGIAVTKLVYHFDYLFSWNPFKKSDRLLIAPTVDQAGAGAYLSFRF